MREIVAWMCSERGLGRSTAYTDDFFMRVRRMPGMVEVAEEVRVEVGVV